MHTGSLTGVTNADTITARRAFSWWDHSLQDYLEDYSSDSLLLHPACVRLRNQLEYAFFDKLNAADIYEHNGIFYRFSSPAYNLASEFVGMEKIRRQVKTLAAWQQKIGKDSVPVYVVIASSKLSYYADELPEYNRTSSERTNYHQYKQQLEGAGINVLDANDWFLREKKNTAIPLMAKGGVHWTLYGGAVMMDSLVNRIRHDKKTDFQQVKMTFSEGYQLYEPDNDAVNLCNLMIKPREQALRVVNFPEPEKPGRKLRAVVISDSFFDVIAWTPLHPQVLDDATPFYYYFKTRICRQGIQEAPVNDAVFARDVEQADCIIIITDVQNLSRFGFGFIEYLEEYF